MNFLSLLIGLVLGVFIGAASVYYSRLCHKIMNINDTYEMETEARILFLSLLIGLVLGIFVGAASVYYFRPCLEQLVMNVTPEGLK